MTEPNGGGESQAVLQIAEQQPQALTQLAQPTQQGWVADQRSIRSEPRTRAHQGK